MYMKKAWMYNRLDNGFITQEFFDGVEEFVNFAKSHPKCLDGAKLKCPCNQCKCRNTAYRDEDIVKVHICRYGFVPNYYNWYCHGELYVSHLIGPSVTARPSTGFTKHTAGSRSIVEHAIDLAVKLGRPPTCWEVFKKTHKKKDESFVDRRSKLLNDELTTRIAQASQPGAEGEGTRPISTDELNNIYYVVVGGRKKTSRDDLSSQDKVAFERTRAPGIRGRPSSSSSSTEVHTLRVENQDLRTQLSSLEQKMVERDAETRELRERQARTEEIVGYMQSVAARFTPNSEMSSPHHFESQDSHDPGASPDE